MNRPWAYGWRWAALLSFALLLQGCGFQLRGEAVLTADIGPVWIEGVEKHGGFLNQLKERLARSGVELAQVVSEAKTRLLIKDRRSSRRVLSVDRDGKVIEYELYESFAYSLQAADGSLLVEDSRVSTRRSYTNPEDLVLGKQEEEYEIRTEMNRQLINDMLRRLGRQLI